MSNITATGNAGADCEVRSAADGKQWANLRVAVTYRDKRNGAEHTDWYTIRAAADSWVGKRMSDARKGDRIVFSGRADADVGEDGKVWRVVWSPTVFEVCVKPDRAAGGGVARATPTTTPVSEDDFDPFAND